jgi:hypothetical protein
VYNIKTVSFMSGDIELITNVVIGLGTTPASYSESSDFKSQPRGQLSIMMVFFFVVS